MTLSTHPATAAHPSPQQLLDAVYPMVHELVGDPFFTQLSREYSESFSEEPENAQHFGAHFGLLLMEHALRHPELDLIGMLPELARMEWLVHDAAQTGDTDKLDIKALGALPKAQQPEVVLHANPSVRLMYSHWPLINVWRAFHDGDMASIANEGGQQWLCIYQSQATQEAATVEPLSDTMAELLGAVLKGMTLAEIAALKVDMPHNLPLLVQKGWLDGFSVPDH